MEIRGFYCEEAIRELRGHFQKNFDDKNVFFIFYIKF